MTGNFQFHSNCTGPQLYKQSIVDPNITMQYMSDSGYVSWKGDKPIARVFQGPLKQNNLQLGKHFSGCMGLETERVSLPAKGHKETIAMMGTLFVLISLKLHECINLLKINYMYTYK